MGYQPRILAFAGSARSGSLNKRLVQIAEGGARAAGARVTGVDLRDLPLPIYDGDLEAAEGLPPNARKLKELMSQHDGLMISSPEYNSSISPLLKNAIDWASRQESPTEPPLACFRGKVAVLMSASPGNLGGLRGLVHLRSILGNIKVIVLPDQVAVSKAHEAFDENGRLKDAGLTDAVQNLGRTLAGVIAKLNA
jgi:NAD(P)H-dependent FMN reductase